MANFMADYGPWGFIALRNWSSIFKILVLMRRLREFYMLSIFDLILILWKILVSSIFFHFLLCFS